MTDRRPPLTSSRRKHAETLERRRKYLLSVAGEPNSEQSRAWDQAEMAALSFAIRTIYNHYRKDTPSEQPAHQ